MSHATTFTLADGRVCTIRHPTVGDARAIIDFLKNAVAETDFLNYMRDEFRMTIEQEEAYIRDRTENPAALALLAELDGRVIATAGCEPWRFKRFSHHADCGLAVARAFWGQGLGRMLMQAILDWGRARRLHKITLRVFARNERAAALYRRLGFIEQGRLKDDVRHADGTLDDVILMAHFYAAGDSEVHDPRSRSRA